MTKTVTASSSSSARFATNAPRGRLPASYAAAPELAQKAHSYIGAEVCRWLMPAVRQAPADPTMRRHKTTPATRRVRPGG